jgi:hypothetical protein
MMKILFVVLLLAGCACNDVAPEQVGKGSMDSLHQQRLAARMRLQALASVGSPGQFVCSRLKVGISEHDWIKGYVVAVTDNAIEVRITDPGQFPHEYQGKSLVAGMRVKEEAIKWQPCIPEN